MNPLSTVYGRKPMNKPCHVWQAGEFHAFRLSNFNIEKSNYLKIRV